VLQRGGRYVWDVAISQLAGFGVVERKERWQKRGIIKRETLYYTESGCGHPLNDAITYVNGKKWGRAIRYCYDARADYGASN
jgi:hypothetical protein